MQSGTEEREILLSLQTLMDWQIIHPGFPHIKITDYVDTLVNKKLQNKACSTVYSSGVNDTNKNIRIQKLGEKSGLSKQDLACRKLQGYLLKKFGNVFSEKLSPTDRIKCPPVRIELDTSKEIVPRAHTRPFDCPYHLREGFDRELKEALDAGVLSPCTESSEWVHQLFPVAKQGQPGKVRLVSDFKHLNTYMKRPVYPTESNSQLLRHIDPSATVFAMVDMTIGYHQLEVHPDDRHYLTVICQAGRFRYNVVSQGIISASDFFNMMTESEGNSRFGEMWRNCLKNMDDVLIAGKNMADLQEKLETFLTFCKVKNIKLKTSKFVI